MEFIKTSARSTNRYIKSTQIDEYVYTLSAAKKNISDTIKRAYCDILTRLESFDSQFVSVIQYISLLDAMRARASVAENMGYCRP